MTKKENNRPISGLSNLDELTARWDKVAFRAQGSPFEDLSVSCLAKNTACRPWSRAGDKVKGDTLARYVYLSFEELEEIEKLDAKAAMHLLQICEATLLFEKECFDLGSFLEIEEKATGQRMRFVEEFGLYQDYPVALANLDSELRGLCEAEEIITLIDMMGFIDRLTDKAWIGGSYRNLQNVFAHGDEKGLSKYFPYRIGHRGFHLPEALSFCLKRLPREDLQAVCDYHERRLKSKRFGVKRAELPEIVETRLIHEFFQCLYYFGRRQQKLLVRLYDSVYLSRELMFLHDPQTEDIIHWLLHLVLGIFRPSLQERVDEELDQISVDRDTKMHKEIKNLLEEA